MPASAPYGSWRSPITVEESADAGEPFFGYAIVDFDAYFHREWLRGLFAVATARLRDACVERRRPERFTLFAAFDLAEADRERPTYAELARRHGLSATDVTTELAAARREFRRLVIDALRQQCATDEEFEAESRALTG